MVKINLYDHILDDELTFVDIVAKYNDQWVLCKKKGFETWECPGGHIERGETSEQAASRELWEETGALDFEIQHIGYYGAKGNDGILKSIDEVYGRIFYAEIKVLASMPNFEIEKICLFKDAPSDWTYPYAHPMFIRLAEFTLNK